MKLVRFSIFLFAAFLAFPLMGAEFRVTGDTVQERVHRGKRQHRQAPRERVSPIVDSALLDFSGSASREKAGGIPPVSSSSLREIQEDSSQQPHGENIVIDEIVAVIGTKMVKLSDVERSIDNMRASGVQVTDDSRCQALEALMVSALYELQADEDSITVSEAEVEGELEARIRYFVDQIGSREKLEEFYGKSILQIKEEYREMIRSNIISLRMEAKITEDVKVTPSEVRRFFATLPKDSIPLVPLTYELQYISRKPIISLSEKDLAKERLQGIRERIEKGEQFRSLAALYSQDPGSARRGGDLGYGARGDWASEFESMAFSLPIGELSPVFETQFGFHILEVLDRKGEMAQVRHILIRPEASDQDLLRARMELDSIAQMVRDGVYTMKEAVGLFSDDAGLQGDGVYINPMTRKPVYTAEELDPMVYLAVQDLAEGQNTNALPYQTLDNQPAFRMFYVTKRIPPHRADINTDYDKIYELALEKAKVRTMQEWMRNKIGNTYVRIMDRFKNCNFMYQWKSM